ncbi:phosphoenolpyruvate carboxykinase (GTP) [Parabacteroides sp. FAFU027]|uniref:phosphoenolpyruvate carboxykinase (GTP) n=1 Tax=Parabacteroides sp. FAFU027 TaxID=2922715 RepID=UPI001FAF5763|nr:phosphoenolpyruvate carboxykinase (GTP) [Parabacteroides sp. FAFU027]
MTKNHDLIHWVNKWAELMTPDKIYWCDGSEEENQHLLNGMVSSGMAVRLNDKLRPNSYYFQSDPSDVARVESRTFICSESREDAGPTNNWHDPEQMKTTLREHYKGCMKGRTMYVIPFCMGPLHSDISHLGVQLTDSPYVVVNMRITTRMGKEVLALIDHSDIFVPCVHSVGYPLEPGQPDVKWPCAPIERKYIAHFPETREIWSFGSGYGGNALLGKKCFALRIASTLALDEGWMAEHMLILGITNPQGEKKYFVAAFPSACGKTNLAMLTPTLPGWKVETIGDDIAWLEFRHDGRLYAVNPENGFFGVAPCTSMDTNPNAMLSVSKNALFTNVGLTPDGDVWWEGIGHDMPPGTMDWKGRFHEPTHCEPIAHLNSRFTAPASQCPSIDPDWENPMGVPISAILFGGRRATTVPLILEARNWDHGVFMGSTIGSEVTAAAIGLKPGVRRDPFAMLPFCGYNMGDYFAHWIEMGKCTRPELLPKIFTVNWFRKKEGQFLWPGYCENSRILAYIFDRCNNERKTENTPLGVIPATGEINTEGLDITTEQLEQLFRIDPDEWKDEVDSIDEHYNKFSHLPAELHNELEMLKINLGL